ncbi:MAG: response regulator transcription factor [Gammaproteobacteria bacterium]|jgi:two-component system phosphate regulon response regulator OmpR|nr:response regulator transcription factor [Gammaproteobacteria bacterium]|tara:strand:- start:1424 stop:2107 length:684 start_codon:yes stop_codon:yes gene_type:complete
MSTMTKALLIDDDQKLGDLLKNYLKSYDIDLSAINDPRNAIDTINHLDPDLLILDVMMPHINGFELCKMIREESDTPIIILSARGESDDKVKGIDLGADDYLSKPFEARELVARIHSLLRRTQKDLAVRSDPIFEVDQQRLEVSLNGNVLDLTTKEFELMDLFIKNPGVIFTRDEIIKEIKGIDAHLFSRSIDILISRLRHKIEDDPKEPKLIKTIWGKGYMFVAVG